MTEARHYPDPAPEESRVTAQVTAQVTGADGTFRTQCIEPLPARLLYSISTAAASAARSLFSTPRSMITDHESEQASWTIQFAGPAGQSENGLWVQIETTHHSFWLELQGGFNRMPLGDRVWHQYDGEDRLLAWALAHEAFLQHLSLLLNDVCTPRQFADVAPTLPNAADTLHCPWYYRRGTDRLVGCFYWTAEQWHTYGASPLWQEPVGKVSPPWRQHLHLPCRLWLQGHRYRHDEVQQIDPGDCLLIPGTFTAGLALRLQPAHSPQVWKADIKKGHLIVKQGPENSSEAFAENQPEKQVVAEKRPDTPPTNGTSPILEVDLTFELGGFTLPLETVEQLQAGYVMELPSELDESQVQVRANGTRIGSGKLVAIGDHLGVQLTDLSYDQSNDGV